MEDAMFIYTNRRPLVCSHESLATFIKPIQTRPLIAKIHRDILLAPKSSPDETSALEKSWEKALSNIFKLYTPIVIGYGGNDDSLMGFLNNLDAIEGGIFWCYRQTNGLPDERIKNLVAKHNGYLVPIEGFDEMMVQLNSCLGYELLDKKILSIAKKRADNYREQFEKIQKSKLSAETSKALDETIKTSVLDWWTVVLNASREKDPNKKEQIYLDGLKRYPESHQLIGTYANFLRSIRKDYDNAEKYYKKSLDLDPNDANSTGNYASFLCDIRKDYDNAEKYYKKSLEFDPNNSIHTGNYANFLGDIRKDYDNAEKYYKKALELDPNNSINTGNYANFLGDIRKDYDNAEKYYKKVLELDPNNADNTGNYAKFLIETGDIPKAEEYIDKAFSLKPDKESLLAELWFYRYAIFPDKYKDAYENIVKLIKSGERSIGWHLENVIEIAKKRGHKEIETLKKLNKIITEDAPIDILNNP
jgi:tetratricopeptide (TPR) repeat protein